MQDVKLIFIDNGGTWSKRITDLDNNVIFEELNNSFQDGIKTKEEFDAWEEQMRQMPGFNIVEVVRFI